MVYFRNGLLSSGVLTPIQFGSRSFWPLVILAPVILAFCHIGAQLFILSLFSIDREPRKVYLNEKVANFYICRIESCLSQTKSRDFLLGQEAGCRDAPKYSHLAGQPDPNNQISCPRVQFCRLVWIDLPILQTGPILN